MTNVEHHWGSRQVNHEFYLYIPRFFSVKNFRTGITLPRPQFLENILFIRYFVRPLILSLSPIICQVFASADFKFVFKAVETKYYVAACVVV